MSAAADTIARMVVGVGADTRDLKRGFAEATREVSGFVREVESRTRSARRALQETTSLSSSTTAAVLEGIRETERAVQLAAAQMRMRIAADLRLDQAMSKQIALLDPFLSSAGFRQGESYARAMAAGFGQGMAAANIRRALGAEATSGIGGVFGNLLGKRRGGGISSGRAEGALIAGAFTLAGLGDAFAEGETKLTKFTSGLNSVLRSASVVAAFFGPGGLLASAVLAGTSFVLDFFAKTRDEAARTAKAIKAEIDRMVDATDQAGLQAKLREVQIGRPSAGRSPDVAGVFQGSLGELRGRVEIQQGILDNALRTRNAAVASVTQRRIRELEKTMAPLVEQERQIISALMNPVQQRPITGARPITVSAPAVGHEFDELQRSAEKALRLYRAISESSQPAVREAQRLVAQYFALGKALDSIRNPWDDQAVSMRLLRAEIEKTLPIVAGLVGALPQPGITGGMPWQRRPGMPIPGASPTGPATFPFPTVKITPPPLTPKDLPQLGFLERTLGVTIGNMVAKVGSTIGSTVTSVFKAAMGPVALLFRALEPALTVLYPLLDKIVAPLAAVAQVIIASLEPALRLLFPVIRAVAVILAFLGEMAQRVTAAVARAFGNLVIAIGKVVKGLSLGFAGGGIIRAGEGILRFADETKASADEMLHIRKKLEQMGFGDTAESITGLGEAARRATSELLNVPYGYRVALDRFNATAPISNAPGGPATPSGPRSGVPGGHQPVPAIVFQGPVTIQSAAKTADELFRDVSKVARDKALSRFGSAARAGEAFGATG